MLRGLLTASRGAYPPVSQRKVRPARSKHAVTCELECCKLSGQLAIESSEKLM